jgi:uroporphyrinogen III methyltransferase/synthase
MNRSNMDKTIIVGTRGSRLALFQTDWVIAALSAKYPDLKIEKKIISTKGDQILNVSLDKIGDKGLFVKEIEAQLLSGDIDFAVHSMKDMPSQCADGLCFAAPPAREDVRDALVLKKGYQGLNDLPQGAKIGTGSKRRAFQLKQLRPDLEVVAIRGNVETRIAKIETMALDGVVLAAAGLHRLDLTHQISAYLEPNEMIPAPAQGALCLQYRIDDLETGTLLNALADRETAVCTSAERSFLAAVDGSCHLPIGAYAHLDGDQLTLHCVFGDEDGNALYYADVKGTAAAAEKLGIKAAETVKERMSMNVSVNPSTVYLVGSGPGDPMLLTRKGEMLIKTCDCVIYDRLIPEDLIRLAPENAEKIYVGKAASNHAMPQDDINELLVSLSYRYQRVVRLKGGDPYVFGRGGEEAAFLKAHAVPFEVVPGISSSIGGLAYAGIPITHRDYASSFHVLTGHFKDEDTDHDWSVIAKLSGTLVFLMSIANITTICKQLMANGKAGNTPLAVVSKAASADQKVYEATLQTAETALPIGSIDSPALLVVGKVVSMRETLNWFEAKPLFGKRILVTRSSRQASRFSAMLESYGAKVIELPMIDFENINDAALIEAIENLHQYTQLWFTSENAIRRFMSALFESGRDTRSLGHLKVLAIGTQTAKWLMHYGIAPDYVPEVFTQEGIIDRMGAVLTPADYILMPTAEKTRTALSEWLNGICRHQSLPVYKTVPAALSGALDDIRSLIESAVDIVTFTSGSTAENFDSFLKANALALRPDAKIASIGPITSQTLEALGYAIDIESAPHTLEALAKAICSNLEVTNETL